MSLDYVLIGRRIHNIRKLLHMTQSELAESVDLTEPYISRIETGVRSGSLDAYVRIAAALGVTVDHILYGNQPHDRLEYQPEFYGFEWYSGYDHVLDGLMIPSFVKAVSRFGSIPNSV